MDESSDPLSDVLDALRVNAVIFCELTGGRPWGLAIPALEAVSVHLPVAGQCSVVADGHQLELRAGDIGILRDGPAQVISDVVGSAATELSDVLAAMAQGGTQTAALGVPPTQTQVICGAFYVDRRVHGALLDVFPPAFALRGDALAAGITPVLVAAMSTELRGPRPGGAAVLRQLGALLFTEIVRVAVEVGALPEGVRGWARALHSPPLRRALRAMHAHTDRRWSLDALAKIAGLSRSAFTAKFRDAVGASPMEYLARWRILRAASLLEGTAMSVAEVAVAVGYASDAALTKAFKAATGVPPASYRAAALRRRTPPLFGSRERG